MTFGRWYPLVPGALGVPGVPGLYQVKIPRGLVDYPSGKSAMIHYGRAEDLARDVGALAARWGDRGYLCRHSVELLNHERADLDAALSSLISQFQRRFGAPPTVPQ